MKTVAVSVKHAESNSGIELDKRTYAPYVLEATCPKCSGTVRRDLTDNYLSYPVTNRPLNVGMYCCQRAVGSSEECSHEFLVCVVVKLTVEAA